MSLCSKAVSIANHLGHYISHGTWQKAKYAPVTCSFGMVSEQFT